MTKKVERDDSSYNHIKKVERERRRGGGAAVADLSGRLSLTGSVNVDERADEERRKEKERRECKMPINR